MRYSKIVMAAGAVILGLTAMVGSLPVDAKTKFLYFKFFNKCLVPLTLVST